MAEKRIILAVLAHPDDETFGMGGTLALYSRQGVEVNLVCATNGDVGEVADEYMKGFSSIAERRISELKCASKILGLADVHFLNYRDSGMRGTPDNNHPKALAAQPVEKVAREVAHFIRQLKPQVVLTFDPVGGYFHPDHIAVHKATVLGFELAADGKAYKDDLLPYQPQKLYYNTFPHGFVKFIVAFSKFFGGDPEHWGRNKDINLVEISQASFPIHARIGYRSVVQIRDEASACHASQGGGGMTRGLLGWWRRTFDSYETFMRAYPVKPPKSIEKDLFQGVK